MLKLPVTCQFAESEAPTMKQILCVLSVLVFIGCANGSPNKTEIHQLAQFADLNFTCDLYSLLTKKFEGEDVFFSPFSITSALAMLKAGAGGNSEEQIRTTLDLPLTPLETDRAYSSMRTILEGDIGNVTLDMANRIYADTRGFNISEDYNKTLVESYGTTTERINFGESEKARKEINDWVEKVTRDKIQELIPAGSLDSNTRMVIANAIYFKGDWAQQFDKFSTKADAFHVSKNKVVKVDMMRVIDQFDVADTEDAYIVDLPYAGKKIVMTLVVPKKRNGLSGIESKLQGPELNRYLYDRPRRTNMMIQLDMPKFKIESSFALKEYLTQVGIKDVFIPSLADLRNITDGQESLFVSEGFHKAFVEVNEEGTEAAAATGIQIRPVSAGPITMSNILVDQPFLVAIRHKNIEEPLFFGRVMSPPLAKSNQ